MRRAGVAVLGATGIVGQRLLRMLEGHPQFRLAEVVGSERRAGKRYGDVAPWAIGGDPPAEARGLELLAPGTPLRSRIVLSALPSGPAREVEPALARAGHVVCTNASAHRMRPDTPLVIPEVNADAVAAVSSQPWHAAGGALVANPNCVVVALAMALAPLERAFGIESATVVTLQALSGAGLGGINAVEMAGNVIPWIGGEEEKIGPELNKILGADIEVAVAVNRVPVLDGHTAHVFCKLRRVADVSEAVAAMEEFVEGAAGELRGALKGELSRASSGEIRGDAPTGCGGGAFPSGALPSLPARPLVVRTEANRPQPRLDADVAGGMAVTVGRVRAAPPPHDLALVTCAHNGVRGAAGACLANAELVAGWLGVGG